jgi:hypothetical protein
MKTDQDFEQNPLSFHSTAVPYILTAVRNYLWEHKNLSAAQHSKNRDKEEGI